MKAISERHANYELFVPSEIFEGTVEDLSGTVTGIALGVLEKVRGILVPDLFLILLALEGTARGLECLG